MHKNKAISGQGRGRNAGGREGGSKTSPLDQKRSVGAVVGGKGTPSAHKRDDLNSNQNSQVVQHMREVDPSRSDLQLHAGTKRSGESESKEVTPDSSISTGCEMSDIWHCTEFRVIVKAMIDTHPQKDDYVAKIEEHCFAHAAGWRQMLEGPSGEQKSEVQSVDVKSSGENRSVDLPAEPSSCHDMEKENGDQDGQGQPSGFTDAGEEDREQDEQEGAANTVAEERSSARENQAAGGGHGGEVGSGDDDPAWNDKWMDGSNSRYDDDSDWGRSDNPKGEQDKDSWRRKEDCDRQDRKKRRNEDNHSWDRSGKQKGRQCTDSWRGQDRGMGAEKYCRSAGDGGGRSRTQYRIVREVDGDLFTAPKEWCLAHCVATDMRMGSGIAVSFRQTFKSVGDLLDQGARVGHIAVLEHEGRYIYYLVTKKYSTEKPRFEDLVSSLQKMREHCAEHGVKNLAMPRIGCGLDRLEWKEVKPKIEEIFSDLDISITIYNFNQLEKEEDSHYPRKKLLQVANREHRLVTIESETALLFFGAEDGSVDKCGEDLDRKFNFMLDYKKQNKVVGEVIRLERRNEVLFGLIVGKKQSDAFSYRNFEKCLYALRKLVKKDRFVYIGIEAFYASNDSDTMDKVISVMKSVLADPNLELYVCWPKELGRSHGENM